MALAILSAVSQSRRSPADGIYRMARGRYPERAAGDVITRCSGADRSGQGVRNGLSKKIDEGAGVLAQASCVARVSCGPKRTQIYCVDPVKPQLVKVPG